MEENKTNYTFNIDTDIIELEDDHKKTNKKKTIILICISSFLFLVIGFVLFDYFIILNSSKNINEVIFSVFSKTNEFLSNYNDNNTKSILESGNLILNTNLKDYDDLNGYNLSYDFEYDKLNKTSFVDLKMNNNIEDIDGKIYYQDGFIYVDFPYLISTMIKFSLDESNIINIDKDSFKNKFDITNDDLKYIMNNISNLITYNINRDKLSKKINKSNVIIEYTIDNNERVKLLNLILDNIVSDDKSLIIVERFFDISKNDIIYYLHKLISNVKEINLKLNTNLLGKIKEIEFNYGSKKIIINKIIDNEIKEIIFESNYGQRSIIANLELDSYQNGTSIDGNVKFNMLDGKYAEIVVSNISSINDKTNALDTTVARSLKELTDKDKSIINKTINLIRNVDNRK